MGKPRASVVLVSYELLLPWWVCLLDRFAFGSIGENCLVTWKRAAGGKVISWNIVLRLVSANGHGDYELTLLASVVLRLVDSNVFFAFVSRWGIAWIIAGRRHVKDYWWFSKFDVEISRNNWSNWSSCIWPGKICIFV